MVLACPTSVVERQRTRRDTSDVAILVRRIAISIGPSRVGSAMPAHTLSKGSLFLDGQTFGDESMA